MTGNVPGIGPVRDDSQGSKQNANANTIGQNAISLSASPTIAIQKKPGEPEEDELAQKMQVAQKAALDEEKPVQGKFTVQRAAHEDEEPRQLKPFQLHKATPVANNTGMPDNLKSGMENLSGMDLSDVKVHYNSASPAQLQAHAYAQGTDIHIAPGQERHLPHEAWHVVQQKQGRVQATMQMKGGTPVNDDAGLEKEADVMGLKAANGLDNTTLPATQMQAPKTDSMPLQRVVQRVNIVPKTINGLTHLVELTEDGHIYNENYLENERDEVQFGDLLYVDLDSALYSRRSMNQENNSQRDKTGLQNQLWVKVISFRNTPKTNTYVRHEMLKEPVKIIQPRDSTKLREEVKGAKDVFADIVGVKSHSLIDEIRASLFGVVGKLHSTSADAQVDLDRIGVNIKTGKAKVREYFDAKKLSEEEFARLDGAFDKLILEFETYNKPKKEIPVGGLITKEHLQQMGFIGLDLGGIGIEEGYLDVNVDDSTLNNKNALVIGNAMNLQASFAPGCTDKVVAILLPLVLMVSVDSVPNRIAAMRAVLKGVDYVTGGSGKASIQFNDNSGDAEVSEELLKNLAAECKYSIKQDNMKKGQWRLFTFSR